MLSCIGRKFFAITHVAVETLISLKMNVLKDRTSMDRTSLLSENSFPTPKTFFVPTKQKFCSLMPKLHKYFIGIKLIFASHFPAALEPNKAQFYTSLPF